MNSKYKWKGGERLMRPAKETAWNLAVRNDICCKELFPGSDIVRSYTFKTAAPRGQSALLAKLNHMLTAVFAAAGEKSALFAEKPDCFECPFTIFRLGLINRPKRNEWYPVQSKRSAQGIFMPKFDCSKDALHIE